MDSLRGVEKVFINKGYSVEFDSKLTGKSGTVQSFDIVAKKENRVYLLDVSAWGFQTDLVALLGKKMDVDYKSIILLDLTGNSNLASLGKPYEITVLNGKDGKHLEELESILNEADAEGKKEKSKSLRKRWR